MKNDEKGLEDFLGEWCECALCVKERHEANQEAAKDKKTEEVEPGAPDVIEFKGDKFCFRKDSSGRPTIYFVKDALLVPVICVDQTEGKYFLQLVESFKVGPYKICMAVKSPNGIEMEEGK